MLSRNAALLLLALASAPFQCSREPDPNQRMEERPGQALYELAETFRNSGRHDAWRTTLQHLIARYPASRFAKMAQHDLDTVDAASSASASPAAPSP